MEIFASTEHEGYFCENQKYLLISIADDSSLEQFSVQGGKLLVFHEALADVRSRMDILENSEDQDGIDMAELSGIGCSMPESPMDTWVLSSPALSSALF